LWRKIKPPNNKFNNENGEKRTAEFGGMNNFLNLFRQYFSNELCYRKDGKKD